MSAGKRKRESAADAAGRSESAERTGDIVRAGAAPSAAGQSPPIPEETAPPAHDETASPAGDEATRATDDTMRRGYARGRARDDAIRANIKPLAPGERPPVVTLAAVIAIVFAIANLATALTGNDISSASGNPSLATAVTTALLLVAGFGMLARQYWAVLGFEAILGLQIVFFSLYLIGVQSLWEAIIPVVAIGLLGWLFWKLVRPMAQLQMASHPSTRPPR
ncbi:MAG: hypothetical protein Q8O56_16800 [Solirubrobacteraceae bacterium]|nr:hypothetical protein [Solirubrobacteraceae bacterium]